MSTPPADTAQAITEALLAKTKPPNSLGALEDLAEHIGVAQRTTQPSVDPARIIVFAADHGVAADGVSAFPPEVTAQMCANFTSGGAAVAVLARQAAATLAVVDVGVAADLSAIPGLVHEKVRPGTANLRSGPAMSDDDVARAMDVGARSVDRAVEDGVRCVALGEMGIGNTTSAAVLTAVCCDRSADEVTGRGTGVAGEGLRAKREVVAEVIERLRPITSDPAEWLRHAGGLEIAALVGAMRRSPQHGIPVVVDGYVVTAAALIATAMDARVRAQLIFAHRSAEPGHRAALEHLRAEPLLDMGLALGEGSGAALALPLLRAACAILAEMATFADAGVSGASP